MKITNKPKPGTKKRSTPITPKQEKIIALKTQNPDATTTEIARQAEADISYTAEILQRYGLASNKIADYRKHKLDIITGLQHRLLSGISQADIEKEPVRNRIVAAGILHDKEQEMTGGSRDIKPMVIINQISVDRPVDKSDIITVENVTVSNSIS